MHHLMCISCRRRTDWFDDRNEALLGELLQVYPQVGAAGGQAQWLGLLLLLLLNLGWGVLACWAGSHATDSSCRPHVVLPRSICLQAVTLEMETAMLLDLARCSKGSIRAAAGVIALADRQSNGGWWGALVGGTGRGTWWAAAARWAAVAGRAATCTRMPATTCASLPATCSTPPCRLPSGRPD